MLGCLYFGYVNCIRVSIGFCFDICRKWMEIKGLKLICVFFLSWNEFVMFLFINYRICFYIVKLIVE